MTRRWCCALAILGLATLCAPAAAEDVPPGRLKFRLYASADGLKNLVIVSIAQDTQGLLWLGTDDGVYRFDGERFTHFSVEDGLASSLVYTVGIAPEGEVCAGSNHGLACWDGTRFSQAMVRGLPAVGIRTIASRAGTLWVGTDGAGMYVRDATGTMVPAPGWSGAPMVRALWADADGVVAGNDTTVVTTTGDGKWQPIGDVGLDHERVNDVLRDRDGALWIRTPSKLWQLAAGARRAVDRSAGLPPGRNLLDPPHSMALGAHGELLVGTDAGVAVRTGDHWRLLERAAGTPSAVARALLVDGEGTLWIGSAGLVQLRGRGLIEYHDAESGLPGDVVWGFARDRDGTLWAGTSECLAHAAGGRWACLPGSEGRVVRSFALAPGGGVFLGGTPPDLLYVDAAGHPRSLGGPAPGPDHDILALAFGPGGDLWVATKAGLFRVAGAAGGALGSPTHVAIPGTQPFGQFSSLAVAAGRVWSATAEGVVVLDHGTWHRFGEADGLRSSDTRYVVARAGDRMCVAYNEAFGVSCFRYADGRISELEHIGVAQGLSTGMVYFIGDDHARRLWIGTGDGVDVVTPAGIEHFSDRDGLAGNDSAATAFLADADGSLWLGATGGASHVLAQYYAGPPPGPRTGLLGGRLGDQALVPAGLEVAHDHNALVVELAAATLFEPARVEYQARLSPFERTWSATHQREVRYPALPPGAYRFEVRARIDTGAWGPVTELRFAIRPAWWQTAWCYALGGLAGLAALAAGFTWRQRRLLGRRTRQLHDQAEANFHAVIDQMPDLISVHRGLEVFYLNRASRRFLGLGDRAQAGSDAEAGIDREGLIARIHPDDRAPAVALFTRVRSLPPQHPSDVIELRMRAADGSWRTCEVWGLLIELGGELTVVSSSRDVTERQRMRAKLLVSDRMASLGTLAAGIAHEINNPLAYVTGNLEAVAEALAAAPTGLDPAEVAPAIHEARDGAERVRRIVHGLRAFSRSEDEQRVALALPDVLEAAIRLTGNEIRHRAELVRELGPVPMVVADDGRLTQVLINLLVNAAHAIPEGHSDTNRITVRMRTDDQGRAVIEVEDTGTGIAPEVQPRVFDPFFTTKHVGEGTGLGLSICHGIVSGLGGQISLENAPAGPGTLARVVLPPAPALPAVVPEVDSAPLAAPARPQLPRVLLVDDEPLIAQTMERLLRRDYDITVATCGQAALDHVAGGAWFDAIVSDVMMPNMTGLQLVEELVRIAPVQAQRMIFLSGGSFTAKVHDRLAQLGLPQLEKPVSAKVLRACVQRIAHAAPPGAPREPLGAGRAPPARAVQAG